MATADYLPNVGGVAAVVHELSKGLARRGHELRILHCRTSYGESAVPSDPSIRVITHRLAPLGVPWRKMIYAKKLGEAVQQIDEQVGLDVIHWHTLLPDGLAVLNFKGRAKKVFTNHTSGFLEAFKHPVRRLEWKWLLRHFDQILAPSGEIAEKSRSLTSVPVTYIPNGVDTARFNPTEIQRESARARLGIEQSQFVILVARRFEVKNGIRYFAEAFRTIAKAGSTAYVLFCGPDYDGLEYPATRSILESADLLDRVRFVGAVPNSEMPLYYRAADVSVIPSLMEATSLTALESMASGLPIIASDVGGLSQLIENELSGLLVPPKEPGRLAEGVLGLMNDRDRGDRLGRNARIVCTAQYSWDRIAEITEGHYH